MYINFQQNWVNRSAKPVRTNIFAKKNLQKLHKFATIPIVFFLLNRLLHCRHAPSENVHVYHFSAKSIKTVYTDLYAKIAICINL